MAVKTLGRGGAHTPEAEGARRDRVRRAHELRSTCFECGGPTKPPSPFGSSQMRSGACLTDGCRGKGHSIGQIAEALGVGHSTAAQYLADPDLSAAHARRAALAVPCADCGQPIDGGRGARQNYRCGWCLRGVPSPRRRETTPTGFREFGPRPECSCGCGGLKAPGRHVCEAMAKRLDRVREEMRREPNPFSLSIAA